MKSQPWREILLIEDNSARVHRKSGNGQRRPGVPVKLSVHRINAQGCALIKAQSYRPGTLSRRFGKRGRAALALELLSAIRITERTLIVAGPVYGTNPDFTAELNRRGHHFVAEIRGDTVPKLAGRRKTTSTAAVMKRLRWRLANVTVRGAAAPEKYCIANVGWPQLDGRGCRLFAAQTGRIPGVHRGTIFALTSLTDVPLPILLRAVGWVRWIRPAARRMERKALAADAPPKEFRLKPKDQINGSGMVIRANITHAQRADTKQFSLAGGIVPDAVTFRHELAPRPRTLNVVELFAGAGGMGLGFLLARDRGRRYRITYSGEINPIYVGTLRANHAAFAAQPGNGRRFVPAEVDPVDLADAPIRSVCRAARRAGAVDVLIGGPPCQGFSNANRNSWHSSNPNNGLVNVFLRYVEELLPPVFVMENVQGIVWTPKAGRGKAQQPSVLEHLARRMESAGYIVFPKLLDAVWYGVPQHRSRFFLLGLKRSLGYTRDDFGTWGPFPRPTHGPGCPNPYVSLKDAIHDLPEIGNGENLALRDYAAPANGHLVANRFLAAMRSGALRGKISDHVTSRHAEYVIQRYRRIPAGGNWEDIAESLTNYANVSRTHSNIYRRLEWSKPAITIGHYRKSMLVHPDQHRGFSLREASRLQSFPDWFRFAGGTGRDGGLMHKQQQLANAVCPLVTKALAELILKL